LAGWQPSYRERSSREARRKTECCLLCDGCNTFKELLTVISKVLEVENGEITTTYWDGQRGG